MTERVRRAVAVPADRVDARRLDEDVALLADLGVHEIRLGLDWALAQPRPGALSGDVVELVLGGARAARTAGVDLRVVLCDGRVPTWFDDEGGFTDAKLAGRHWPRWVEACAEAFGDAVGGWVPLDRPLSIADRLVDDPRRHGEVVDTLVVAWRDAWRILRGGPPVATSLAVRTVRPVDESVPAAQAARRRDELIWRVWLQGLRDGVVSIPGRADRELADLAGACDEVGVVVRHETEVLGLVHRAAEQGPERPLSVVLRLPAGPDVERDRVVRRFVAGALEAAAEVPVRTIGVTPAFDLPGDASGIVTHDRDVKDSAHGLVEG